MNDLPTSGTNLRDTGAQPVGSSDLLHTTLVKSLKPIEQSSMRPSNWRRFFAKIGLKSILAGLFLLLLVAGGVAAMVLVQLNQDTRQQASGFVYEKCDYGNNNEKPVCLDSEPTYGNCVICKNGEKHVLPNAECGNNLCAKAQPKTCTDGNNTFNEGGTACNSYTDCLKCVDGHWVSTDRWNCSQGSTCYAAEPTKPPPTATPRPSVTIRPSVTTVPSGTPRPTVTPKLSPTVTSNLLKDGSRCSSNTQCQSGSCVPTPYGNYCGTTNSAKCKAGESKCDVEGGTSYTYSCNSNGFFVKSERCDGGCSGNACKPGVCAPGKSECDGKDVKTCNSTGTAWTKQSCGTGRMCVLGSCDIIASLFPTNTPKPSPTSVAKLPNGSGCNTNAQCSSGSCVPTPYGNYCGTTNASQCAAGQSKCENENGVSYVYSCNVNGFYVKSQRCDGGCSGNACNANVCTRGQVRCASSTEVETCSNDGTAWVKSSCWTGESCSNGVCGTSTSVTKSPDGTQCNTNAQCSSGSCVPTPYGNYCGTTTAARCTTGQNTCEVEGNTSYVFSCNANGFYVKSERCDGGCSSGACLAGVCKANESRCTDGGVEVCNAAGTAWSKQSCWTGQVCQEGVCVNSPTASCDLSANCNNSSTVCVGSENQRYMCQGNQWSLMANGKTINFYACDEEEIAYYTIGVDKVKNMVEDMEKINIWCESPTSEENLVVCGFTTPIHSAFNSFVASCKPSEVCEEFEELSGGSFTDEEMQACISGQQSNQEPSKTASHEIAHNWALQNFGDPEIPSFNEKIGCEAGESGYNFREAPPRDYGRTNCAEAFAVSVEYYLYYPCILEDAYPLQYEWMTEHPDSPFRGEDACNQ